MSDNRYPTVSRSRSFEEALLIMLNEAREERDFLMKQRDALREDARRLDWLADEPICDGFAGDTIDVWEMASIVARQNEREEATTADRRRAFRMCIDIARTVVTESDSAVATAKGDA